jgi:dihydropteroate synthase
MNLRCGGRVLALDQPVVMGVLNVTPDSFSDGGRFLDTAAAAAQARRMVAEGAVIVDVGGESTRPNAAPVDTLEQLRRVLPVIESLAAGDGAAVAAGGGGAGRDAAEVLVSVDTSDPEVMRRAVRAGAVLINDVRALQRPGALDAAAESGAGICLMHMQGEPAGMQRAPHYDDLVAEISAFLDARLRACERAGIARERLCVDPGFGFGKTTAHNLELLRRLNEFHKFGVPLLVGLSRKSLLRAVTGREVADRLAGSVALATVAALQGADILRAHDVAATVDALAVVRALR